MGTRRWAPRGAGITTEAVGEPVRVAVLGTGPAALACVRSLASARDALKVSWFTSRGKLTTQMGPRNQTLCQAGKPFHDYGCQYFTAKDPVFEGEVATWAALGACQALPDGAIGRVDAKTGFTGFSGSPCWVGNGGMSPMMAVLMKHTAEEFKDVLEHVPGFPNENDKIQSLWKAEAGWNLATRGGRAYGPFDLVVGAFSQHCLTDPFLKSGGAACAPMLSCLRRVESNQIIAMQLILEWPVNADFVAAHVLDDPDLAFVSNNSRKPQQSGQWGTLGPEHWTLLSTAGFAEQEFNRNPKGYRRSAERRMLASFAKVLGLQSLDAHGPQIQRINHWEDGLPVTTPPESRGCLFDVQNGIGWCGDFCAAPCVEGAFLSGLAMAGAIASYAKSPATFDGSGFLPAADAAWPRLHVNADAAQVDIGAFPGLAAQLPSRCTHTELVPSAVDGYQKEAAHFGAGASGGKHSDRAGKGKGKGKSSGRGKGKYR